MRDVATRPEMSRTETSDSASLAADLHDQVIAALTLLILEMEEFKRDQYNRDGVRIKVAQFQSEARTVLSHLRDVVHGMLGDQPELGAGLVQAVERGPLRELQRRTGAVPHVRVARRWPSELDSFTATQVFRVIDQALRNIADHSSAKNVWLAFLAQDDRLAVDIRDDGVGFPWARARKGQGLTGMEQRALLLGGRLVVKNRPTGGALVRIVIPAPS